MNRNSLRRSSVMLVLSALGLLLLAGCSSTNSHVVTSIDVTPHNPSIPVATTQQFTATAHYGSGAPSDVTSQVTWSSDTPADATITPGGLASGVAPGSSKISATLGTVSGNTTLTITAVGATLQTITVAPLTPTIAVGATVDFVATGHYSDGSSQVLPGVTWGTGTPATASITTTGVAVALATGSSQITATFNGVPGNTLLTVQPAFARNAYASGTSDSNIATYVLNSALPTLTSIASNLGSGVPVQIIPEPSGRFAYILNSNSIVTITVDPASGRLVAPTSQLSTPSINSDFGVVDPTGQYLYVVSSGASSTLNPYLINLTNGSLSAIGSPVSGFSNLISVIVDRSGKYLYAVDNGVNKVFAYSIGAGGALTALATPNYPVGNVAQYPAIDPSNNHLYIPNQSDGSITAFTVNADGSLAAVAGSPFTTGIGVGPSYAAVDTTGKFLFVTNNVDSTISSLSIGAGGALGAAAAGSPYSTGAAGATPFGIAIDPSDSTVAVSNLFGNSIALFTLTSATGVLTPAPLPQVESPAGVYFINLGIGAASHTINPGAVFAANSVSGDISAFTSTAGTGVLAAAAASPFPGLAGNSFAAADLQGNFLFTGSAAGTQVGGFSVTQSSAAVAALTGSPLTVAGTDLASALYVAPNDTFAYALDVTSGSVVQYTITPGTRQSPALEQQPSLLQAQITWLPIRRAISSLR